MVAGTMFQFWINDLFGGVMAGIFSYATLLMFICMLGKTGIYLMISIVALYLMCMFILFGGMAMWIIIMISSAIWFAIQLIKLQE